MNWEVALKEENKLQMSRESKHVNDILGLNYKTLDDIGKLIFLDVAILFNTSLSTNFYKTIMSVSQNWWDRKTSYEWQISFIATLHGITPFAAGMKVGMSFFLVGIEVCDLYVEFSYAM